MASAGVVLDGADYDEEIEPTLVGVERGRHGQGEEGPVVPVHWPQLEEEEEEEDYHLRCH